MPKCKYLCIAFSLFNILGNLLAAVSSSYPVCGSFSRSALNAASGARTPLAKVTTMVLSLLIFIPLSTNGIRFVACHYHRIGVSDQHILLHPSSGLSSNHHVGYLELDIHSGLVGSLDSKQTRLPHHAYDMGMRYYLQHR